MRFSSVLAVAAVVALAMPSSGVEEQGVARISNRFFLGVSSTTTYSMVSVSTSTVFFSCLSGTYTEKVCKGRNAKRKRKSVVDRMDDGTE